MWYLATTKEQQLYIDVQELSVAKVMLPTDNKIAITGEEFMYGEEEKPLLHHVHRLWSDIERVD